jgi:hypothetical protein
MNSDIKIDIEENKRKPSFSTPRTKQRKLRVVEFKQNTFFRSCCGLVCDKRLLKFIMTVVISLLVLSFCMAQIIRNDDLECKENLNIYFTILGAILSYYVPAPSLPNVD